MSNEIKVKINEVIYEIANTFIEFFEDDGFDIIMPSIFPPSLVRENFSSCQNVIYDLRDYSKDKYKHSLNPLYQYALFHLIDWYIDLSDSSEEIIVDTSSLENLIPEFPDDKYFIDNLHNLEEYKEFMFDDWDFLHIEDYVKIYFELPNYFNQYGIDLSEYLDLIPKDIAREYLELEKNKGTTNNRKEKIVRTIYEAIVTKEKDPIRLKNTSETQLSDDIADLLISSLREDKIIVVREQPMGFALKGPGELDFYIYSNIEGNEEIAIGENKEWGNFEKQIKQLIGYMNERIEFGFTIVFNKSTQLKTVLNRRKEFLNDFYIEHENVRYFETLEMILDFNEMSNVLVTKHRHPESEQIFELYHFVCNAYRPERKSAAKQARLK
ncbi:hypothetical protein EVJ29_01530 [Exiguobacterium sp. SH4S7]|uniref:hypothetical protein n=1 Tax=Exiguobacterium sp. SH4S7 TaxID=2510958 RepID=UPI00103FE40F|nr:hypothetical protein [Exiguobacterium sp. SH4S7]TCI39343.1 hypothetical protein EVJ29_01530 [Exiguobacterium sp. SH4S7]